MSYALFILRHFRAKSGVMTFVHYSLPIRPRVWRIIALKSNETESKPHSIASGPFLGSILLTSATSFIQGDKQKFRILLANYLDGQQGIGAIL